MTVSRDIQKDLDARIAALTLRCKSKRPIVIAPNGESVTWGSFRSLQLRYSSYPPEFRTEERFLDEIVLTFARHRISFPVLALLDSPADENDRVGSALLKPLQMMYRAIGGSSSQTVPFRLRLQWTRRLATEFAWEGRLLTLMNERAALQPLMDVEGSHFAAATDGTGDIARRLKDEPSADRIGHVVKSLLRGRPGEWWVEADVPIRLAEELRLAWLDRYEIPSLHMSAASWFSPAALILAVFLESYASETLAERGCAAKFGSHLRVALDAQRRMPDSEMLLALGQTAYRLRLYRTAWYLLRKSARTLPAPNSKDAMQYRYSPWLLSTLGELAKRAGAAGVGRDYDTWFEERALATGHSESGLSTVLTFGIPPK